MPIKSNFIKRMENEITKINTKIDKNNADNLRLFAEKNSLEGAMKWYYETRGNKKSSKKVVKE